LNAGTANGAPQPLGTLTQLGVQKGDTVTVTAYGLYQQPVDHGFLFSLASFITNLFHPAQAPPPGLEAQKRQGFPLLQVGVAAGLASIPQLDKGVPKGYLRLVVFDKDSALAPNQPAPVQLSLKANGGYEQLRVQLVLPQDGYVTAYVGNESDVDVLFDDVEVEHRPGLQVQETQYDPVGLELAGLAAPSPGIRGLNNYRFNGKEFQADLGLNWNHQDWRFLDPTILRWNGVDPELENGQETWTPYSFGFDNAVRYADADGRWPGPGGLTSEPISMGVHTALDVAGLIPGAGEIADGANALLYLAEGNKVDAALSVAAMIPLAGMAATGAKFLRKAEHAAEIANDVVKHGDEVVELAKKGEDLFVGGYGQSYRANVKSGLNSTHTPHHAVQDAVSTTSHGKGPTINLRKDIHEKTVTFGKPRRDVSNAISANKNNTNPLRVHLAADIKELRTLLKDAGYNSSKVNTQLTELIKQNKATGSFVK
jgi:RHS repeat-associated protein